MEKLLLGRILAADELHVVDHQQIDRAELILEVHRRAEAQCANELVHEFLGRQVDHLAARGVQADMPGDRVHQMGLAEADAAIEEERVERHGMDRAGAGLGNPPGGGMGQFVGLADDEILEREARVERRRQMRPVVGDVAGRSPALRERPAARPAARHATRFIAPASRRPADRRSATGGSTAGFSMRHKASRRSA